MAPVLKRRMIDSTDSTSSIGTGLAAGLKSIRPRSVQRCFAWLSTSAAYSLKAS